MDSHESSHEGPQNGECDPNHGVLAGRGVDAKELERQVPTRQHMKVDEAPDVRRKVDVELPFELEALVTRATGSRPQLAICGRLGVAELHDERRVVHAKATADRKLW